MCGVLVINNKEVCVCFDILVFFVRKALLFWKLSWVSNFLFFTLNANYKNALGEISVGRVGSP